MSLDITNTDKLAALKQEAESQGITLLPPDINRSDADFTIEPLADGRLAIRHALAAVKKVGLAAMQAVVEERRKGGPFRGLADFARRIDPRAVNKMQIENLARAGAFDALEKNRARLFAGAEAVIRRAQAAAEERGSDQIALFGGLPQAEPELRLPEVADWSVHERLEHEAEAIGFHMTAHPLDAYAKALARLGVVRLSEIASRVAAGAGRLKLAGAVVGTKERDTKSGSRMCWLRISDPSASTEVTLFSEVLGRSRPLLVAGAALLVTADARLDGETLRLTAVDLEPLEQAAARAGSGMRLRLDHGAAVDQIKAMLAALPRGRGRVTLLAPALGREVEISLPGAHTVTPPAIAALRSVPGVAAVEEV
jgi:DNA polymerase-3 subunit alpha